MREFTTREWYGIVHRVDPSARHAIMLRRGCGGLKHITAKSLWVQEAVHEYFFFKKKKVPRYEMHAHVFASPSSAEGLRKHLTKLNAHRDTSGRGFNSGL